jgi:flagellar biosynthesis/type III secretory pathway M-ring protein FliF/YscJ
LPLGDIDTQRVKELVGAAVGANAGRGDTVAVTTLQQAVQGAPASLAGPATRAALDTPAAVNSGPYLAGEHARPQETTVSVLLLLAGLAAVVLVAMLAARLRRPDRQASPAVALAGAEREAVLANLRNWLAHDTPREAP